ncbi:MAG TPA: ABC transporter permease [Terriglobales bacterium]|nr:ABC transporter permease [Terriglobales bacterium]
MATEPRIEPLAPAAPAPSRLRYRRWASYTALLTVRMKELLREPEVIFWAFAFPLLLAIGLGIAFRQAPVEHVPVAVAAGPGSAHVAAALGGGRFQVSVLPAAQALDRFRLGAFDLVIVPANGGVTYRFDLARPESLLARSLADDALQAAAGRRNPLPAASRPFSEPGARYIDFLIPGLLGMNLMNSGMWLGFALVEMRQRKLLKRLVATPMRRADFLLALGSSRLLLMLLEVFLLLACGVWLFRMRVMGSWGAILILGVIGAIGFSAMGLLASARAEKIESASGIINLVTMPMWVFSGVFFSYERFPHAVLPLIRALPLTALNDALRAVILQGAPLASQGWQMLIVALWGGLAFLLALKWFRWT